MPSGYDKSSDYGGPPVRRWTTIVAALILAVIGGITWWLKH